MNFWPDAHWPSDRFSVVADIATLFGLVFSFAAALYSARTGQAVRQLNAKYKRRDLLPGLAQRYQQLYGELQLLVTQSPDTPLVKVKLSELEGMLNNLKQYLAKCERQTPEQINQLLKLITKQPKSPDHYQNLLSLTAKFSVELDHIARETRWNSQL